jgi:GTP-binding protein
MGKVDATEAISGDVAMIAGLTNIYIGDTVTDSMDTPSLPTISIDEPTISLNFLVNDSPIRRTRRKICNKSTDSRST